MTELDALRAIDLDWAMHLRSVWRDPPYDVPQLHHALREEMGNRLDSLGHDGAGLSPLGWPVVGSGGTGKTHLLSVLRGEAFRRGVAFVLVDMTDVHDFWETVLLGFLSSLQQECDQGRFQHEAILERFINLFRSPEPTREILDKLRRARTKSLAKMTRQVLEALSRKHPRETLQHQDVIRALIALNSADFEVASTGLTWLQGHPLEDNARRDLGFNAPKGQPREIIAALSWLMSLAGPTVLALDQVDPIVTWLNIAAGGPNCDEMNEEVRVARSIIEKIAAGLGALRDVVQRTLIVVSCLETTWARLKSQVALAPNLDRYESPRQLHAIQGRPLAEAVLRSRLDPAYRRVGFRPPYPTWPFAPESLDLQGVSPRQVLKFAYEHVNSCLAQGRVTELRKLDARPEAVASVVPCDRFTAIDEKFKAYQQRADLASLLAEKMDDEGLAPLLQTACRCLILENHLPEHVSAVVDVDFHGGRTTRPLHARLRLIHTDEGEREEHFCLRALQRVQARAFQARLNAAMIQSGIDRRLGFRRLVILRSSDLPGGPVTQQLLARFENSGGLFHRPDDDEIRTLWALRQMDQERDPLFADWLRERKPVSRLPLMAEAVPPLCADERRSKTPTTANAPAATPPPSRSSQSPPPQAAAGAGSDLTLGWQCSGQRPVERVHMPVALLEKHTVILAGAGSGKTVLIRRLIEEAALLEIPSIVIDGANDLATLGDRWPEAPAAWQAEDHERAEAYFQTTETVIWTPGRASGNPLHLEPLPDLAALADDADELNSALDMVRESLRKTVAPGAAAAAQNKLGVLSAALRYFAKHGGGTIVEFMRLLRELPADAALGIDKEEKLAREMADLLKSEIESNPLLREAGAALDPGVLFGDVPGCRKVRVSVINFVGLPGLDSQRQFVSQLAMTLFSWIKKNPQPPGRPLRGLLVLDEAKDFVPSQGSTVCKPSLMRLAAQARKYHLGVVFATQNPKEMENTIIGNCSTQFFGRAGSPEAIRVVRDQIHLRGGSGDDVPTLPKGTFYVYNADAGMQVPKKVLIPMCLSHHRPSPLEETEILERARESRERLGL
jgi:hypothetical protein